VNSLSNYFFAGRVTAILGAKTYDGDLLFEFTVKQVVSENEQHLTVVVGGKLAKMLGTAMSVADHVVGVGSMTWRNEYNNTPLCRCYYLYKTAFWGGEKITKKKPLVQPQSDETVIWDD